MNNQNQIDLTEVLQTIIKYKYLILIFVIIGGLLGFYIANKNLNHSVKYGVKIYGFPEYKISGIIDVIKKAKDLNYENKRLSKINNSDTIEIRQSLPTNEYSLVDNFILSPNKNSVFLDILYHKVLFSNLIDEVLENFDINQNIEDSKKINIDSIIKKSKFTNIGNSPDALRPQVIFYLNLEFANENALELINLILKKGIKITLNEFSEQLINSLLRTKKDIEKNINKINNENYYDNLLNGYLEFLLIHKNYAKENNIQSNNLKNKPATMANEFIMSLNIDDFSQDFKYFLKGYELISLEYQFIEENFDQIKKILILKNVENITALDWFEEKLAEINVTIEEYNNKNLSYNDFIYDMSEPIISTNRNYTLVYILSSLIIFLIFSIFLSILLDSRK